MLYSLIMTNGSFRILLVDCVVIRVKLHFL